MMFILLEQQYYFAILCRLFTIIRFEQEDIEKILIHDEYDEYIGPLIRHPGLPGFPLFTNVDITSKIILCEVETASLPGMGLVSDGTNMTASHITRWTKAKWQKVSIWEEQ